MNNPLLSIIIPVYNRADLIEETLESILCQTYTNWECILVDDWSTDDSLNVMQKYQKKDARFKAFLRPIELNKGANSSRNYGFLQAKGSYIKWFDSDDIMLPNHLETACRIIILNRLDFVITDLINFKHEDGAILDKPYNFDRNKAVISAENFALYRIGWTTVDFLGTREIVEKIKFNEYIVDGDEYNFFIKLLHQPCNGMFINELLTLRRIHSGCITIQNEQNKTGYLSIKAVIKFQTANDLVVFNDYNLIRWFLSGYMHLAFSLANEKEFIPFCKPAFKLICKYYSFLKGCAFILALGSVKWFGKGYRILKYARK
ncbi:glycosyltransferase family 2 protein [Flavobacterium ranwuense]|uniref:Glycosyltransferase family 2 protein n=1 Tax=Flavobacterium ranwuense TaxID=2541725 RepID=A0ABY2DPF4_9FLAO|nr:glycosyltransferase family 2 protein [Flavobacterium ranwuense]TDE28050.1 glycosyltransferase family 2 protein [Flavobacterium ranwuense]